MTLLSIDVGTTNVKAVIFDLHGNIVEKVSLPLGPYLAPEPSWSEQDPDHFWHIVCQVCQKLQKKSSVQGVALTTQRATVINLDKQGKPLRPAITWMDGRRAEKLPRIKGLWGYFRAIRNLQAQAKSNWIKTHQKEIWEATDKFLLLSGYLIYRFTGEYVDSVGSQVGYIPFDFKRHTWAKKNDWKWQALSITPDQLPRLVPCGEVLGTLTPKAAEQTGLAKGLPLIAAAADKACEVLGSGCIDSSKAALSFGTSATVNLSSQKYVELYHYLPPYPAAFPQGYNNEYQIFKGFWMVDWFCSEFQIPRDALESLLENRTPGARGLLLDPFWSPGLKLSESAARGAILGFKDYHHKGHIYQAVLEGLCFRLRQGLETLQKTTHTTASCLLISGGGSQSDAALQIAADIFGVPACRPHIYETSSLGAAINIAVAQGHYPDYPTAVKEMTRIGKTFEPHSHAVYDEIYHRVYRKVLKKLLPLHRELQQIENQVVKS